MENCVVCGKNAPLRCRQCKREHYCGEVCQAEHWENHHRAECRATAVTRVARPMSDIFSKTEGLVSREVAAAAEPYTFADVKRDFEQEPNETAQELLDAVRSLLWDKMTPLLDDQKDVESLLNEMDALVEPVVEALDPLAVDRDERWAEIVERLQAFEERFRDVSSKTDETQTASEEKILVDLLAEKIIKEAEDMERQYEIVWRSYKDPRYLEEQGQLVLLKRSDETETPAQYRQTVKHRGVSLMYEAVAGDPEATSRNLERVKKDYDNAKRMTAQATRVVSEVLEKTTTPMRSVWQKVSDYVNRKNLGRAFLFFGIAALGNDLYRQTTSTQLELNLVAPSDLSNQWRLNSSRMAEDLLFDTVAQDLDVPLEMLRGDKYYQVLEEINERIPILRTKANETIQHRIDEVTATLQGRKDLMESFVEKSNEWKEFTTLRRGQRELLQEIFAWTTAHEFRTLHEDVLDNYDVIEVIGEQVVDMLSTDYQAVFQDEHFYTKLLAKVAAQSDEVDILNDGVNIWPMVARLADQTARNLVSGDPRLEAQATQYILAKLSPMNELSIMIMGKLNDEEAAKQKSVIDHFNDTRKTVFNNLEYILDRVSDVNRTVQTLPQASWSSDAYDLRLRHHYDSCDPWDTWACLSTRVVTSTQSHLFDADIIRRRSGDQLMTPMWQETIGRMFVAVLTIGQLLNIVPALRQAPVRSVGQVRKSVEKVVVQLVAMLATGTALQSMMDYQTEIFQSDTLPSALVTLLGDTFSIRGGLPKILFTLLLSAGVYTTITSVFGKPVRFDESASKWTSLLQIASGVTLRASALNTLAYTTLPLLREHNLATALVSGSIAGVVTLWYDTAHATRDEDRIRYSVADYLRIFSLGYIPYLVFQKMMTLQQLNEYAPVRHELEDILESLRNDVATLGDTVFRRLSSTAETTNPSWQQLGRDPAELNVVAGLIAPPP